MPRDSILNEAEEKAQQQDQDNGDQNSGDGDGSDGESRQKLTQRMPADLVDEVDRIKEEYGLGSRNATINFMVKQAAKDL
jgi:hypothetical protein